MFVMFSVAALCAVVLIGGLVRLVCRHRGDLWIASDDAILCVVSPLLILLGTLGAVSIGWRVTHGGFAAVTIGGWIGAAAIVAAALVIWRVLAARIRAGAREPARAAPVSS